jgi:hypothetical protein
LVTTFTEQDKAALSAAGDDPLRAVVSSADSLGPKQGDYTRRDTVWNDSTYSILVIVPRDSAGSPQGEWRVTFDDFGEGNGDYELVVDPLGQIFYQWVGPGMGRYRPERKLPLPQDHQLADLRLHVEAVKGVKVGAELAASHYDQNTFSNQDDGDDNGAAYATTVDIEPQNLHIGSYQPERLHLYGSLRQRDARFLEISRVDAVEFQREWDTQRLSGIKETVREVGGELQPIHALALQGGYGELSRGNVFHSERRTGQVQVRPFREWAASYNIFHLTSQDSAAGRSSRWIRQRSDASGKWWRLRPRGGVEWEDRRDKFSVQTSGFRYLEWNSGLGIELPAQLNIEGEYRRRIDDSLYASQYFRYANAYTASSQAEWHPSDWGRTLLRYAHREKTYTLPDSADVRTDIARWEAFFVPQSRLVDANWTYDLASTRSPNQVLVALQVPAGTGNYRREGGTYVPDDQGDIILVPRNTGLFVPVTEVRLNSIVWLKPDEAKSQMTLPAWLGLLASETELQIDEQTRYKTSLRLLLLDPSLYRGDSTLFGNLSIREDLHFQRLSSKFSVRLRYHYSNSLQNQYLNGGEEQQIREGGIRVRATYTPRLRGTTELTGNREIHLYRITPLPSREIRRASFDESITCSLASQWELGSSLGAGYTKDRLSNIEITLIHFAPRASYMILGRGRADAEVRANYARSTTQIIPFELGEGANRGMNWRWELTATYQFARNFSSSLNYSGRADHGEPTYHTGRIEARASF